MSSSTKRCVLAIALFSILSTSAFAAVPKNINYQGRLTDATGASVPDGLQSIRFRIYNVETGGVSLWDSNTRPINTVDGLFTYNLGSAVAFPNGLFDDTDLWLGITVAPNAEMIPRIRLTSTAFTHHASFADSANIPSGSIDSTMINSSQIQLRVFDTAATGTAIVGINPDGTVITRNFGDITGVLAGPGLSGGGNSGVVTLSLDTTTISIGGLQIIDNSIKVVDIDTTEIQARVTGVAPAGTAITSINSDGTVGTSPFGDGDITAVLADSGLTGGGTSGSVTVGIATNGVTQTRLAPNSVDGSKVIDNSLGSADVTNESLTSADLGPNSVGTSEVADNSLTQADLATNSVAAAEIQDGTVGSAEIANNSLIDADISTSANIATSKISGTAVNLTSTQTITGTKRFTTRTFFDTDIQIGNAPVPVPGVKFSALGLVRMGSDAGAPGKQIVIPGVAGAYTDWDGDFWQVNNRGSGNGGFKWTTTAVSGTSGTPGWIMSLDNTGHLTTINGVSGTSDVRYKKNIANLSNSLRKVMQLRAVRYEWRKDEFPEKHFGDKPQIGLIAQELKSFYPELVYEDNEGYLSIDYSRLSAVLVDAIQVQQEQIRELHAQLDNLKSMQSELTEVKALVRSLVSKSTDSQETYSAK